MKNADLRRCARAKEWAELLNLPGEMTARHWGAAGSLKLRRAWTGRVHPSWPRVPGGLRRAGAGALLRWQHPHWTGSRQAVRSVGRGGSQAPVVWVSTMAHWHGKPASQDACAANKAAVARDLVGPLWHGGSPISQFGQEAGSPILYRTGIRPACWAGLTSVSWWRLRASGSSDQRLGWLPPRGGRLAASLLLNSNFVPHRRGIGNGRWLPRQNQGLNYGRSLPRACFGH